MIIYLLRRIVLALVTLFILTLVSFSLVYYPHSSPFSEHSFLFGYFSYLYQILMGDLGVSVLNGKSILTQIQHTLPTTLELCALALLFALIFGVTIALIAAIHYQKWPDYLIRTGVLFGISLPTFWLALLLVMVFSLRLDWLPISGRYDLSIPFPRITGIMFIDIWLTDLSNKQEIFLNLLKHSVLPVLTLMLVPLAEIIHLLRTSLLNVLQQNYIKSAESRGLSKWMIIHRHALHNAIPPVIPVLGLHFPTMLTLTMIVEIIFNWQGIGHWLIYALHHQDFIALSAGVLVIGTIVILVSLIADIIGIITNPLTHKEIYVLQ